MGMKTGSPTLFCWSADFGCICLFVGVLKIVAELPFFLLLIIQKSAPANTENATNIER